MPCCYESGPDSDSGRNWCQDLETVYTDAEGKDYCVFHAPQGKKGVSLEEFNELIFARIREAQEQHKPCDLSGTIFQGDVSFHQFDKDNPFPEINFLDAQFKGDVSFFKTQFSGEPIFERAQFSGNTNFVGSQFSGDAYFCSAQFSGHAIFGGIQFSRDVDFADAEFSRDTHFHSAQFSGDADFLDARFSGNATFYSAQFSGNAAFSDARFSGNADFEHAQFSGDTYFHSARFSGEAHFDYIRIPGKARLIFWNRGKAKTFVRKASFIDLDIEGTLIFEGVDLSAASFTDTQVQKIDFVNPRWHRSGPRGWRNTLYDEIALFDRMKKVSIQDGASVQGEERPKKLYTDFENWMERIFFYAEKYGDDIRKVEILYRRMKDKYRNLQNWPEVSNWHYGEKEMYRKENAFRRYFPFSFSFLYWLSSGYGERYEKAGIVLAVLVFTLSFGLAWTGLDAAAGYGSNPGDFHGIRSITLETLNVKSISALLMNTLKYATFQKDVFFVPRNMWGEIIRCLAQILIPIQTALFILAVRNRFRK